MGDMSLWEMIERGLVAEAAELSGSLEKQATLYRELGAQTLPPQGLKVTTSGGAILEREPMACNVAASTQACQKWSLNASTACAFDTEVWIRILGRRGTFLELAGRLDSLRGMIKYEAMLVFPQTVATSLSGTR
jgi:hypothetical protein